MLHYELTKSYLYFLSSLSLKERGAVLWNSQSILSQAGGYLKLKVKDLSDELAIFRVYENIYLLALSNYSSIRLIDGKKTLIEPNFSQLDSPLVVSKTIKELVNKDEKPLPEDELSRYLTNNYFTSWFIKLLSFVDPETRNLLARKDAPSLVKEKKEEKPSVLPNPSTSIKQSKKAVATPTPFMKKPVVKQAIFSPPQVAKEEPHYQKSHNKIDGAQYEKMILLELQEAYQKRLQEKKGLSKTLSITKLKHVRFAPKEILITYKSEDDCLELLLRKTKQNGCRLSNDDWLILLTNKVDEDFADEIESHYPNHVVYTDEPDKGSPSIAFIVNPASQNKTEQAPEIRRIKSKTASFAPTLPEQTNDDFDDFDFDMDEDGYLKESDDEDYLSEPMEEEDTQETIETSIPKYWHCYLCGKKKLYTGEPAKTIKLSNGKIAYLCKKHRDKM